MTKRRVGAKRSVLATADLAELLGRRKAEEREIAERGTIAKHRSLLARQAKALIAVQEEE